MALFTVNMNTKWLCNTCVHIFCNIKEIARGSAEKNASFYFSIVLFPVMVSAFQKSLGHLGEIEMFHGCSCSYHGIAVMRKSELMQF